MSETKDSGGRALQEFLSEAQEIAEQLASSLMAIEKSQGDGEPDPDMINDLFRGMHTLKSLAGMFGVSSLSKLAHHEENLLDGVRLGKVSLDMDVLDLLFESIDVILQVLTRISEEKDVSVAEGDPAIESLIQRFDGDIADGSAEPELEEISINDPVDLLGREVLEVLTEYEEHRLRTNIERGLPLYFVHTLFDLNSIDVDLEAVKARLKPAGEIITYLPSADESDPEKLGINIIIALRKSSEELQRILEGLDASIEPVSSSESKTDSTDEVVVEPDKQLIELEPSKPEALEAVASKELSRTMGDQGLSVRSVSQTVRVDIRKLDILMNVVGELAILRSAIEKVSDELRAVAGRRELSIELHRINRGFERRLDELREGILEVRMVPLGQMFDRLARIVRKLSRELDKEVNLVISGADTEVDKLIIEELSDPLMHIIRNAIDHGVEDSSSRTAVGKPEQGTVALTAYQKGNHVVIEVEDDGAGIDSQRLMKAAISRGLVSEEQAETLSTREIQDFLFMPGISTTAKTTEISGRGVGMDVVKTNIGAIGGVIELQSEVGIGTKFTLTLPVTLAIIPALLVVVDDATYAIPLNTVSEALFVYAKDVNVLMGMETITLRGQTLSLCRLDRFFGIDRSGPIRDDSRVVVASLGQRRVGLVVDTLIGQQDVVIKPLGDSLESSICFSGATDIGNDSLSLVLDTAVVIDDFFKQGDGAKTRLTATEES